MFAYAFDIFPIFVETENMYVLYTSAARKIMINNVSITILQIMTENKSQKWSFIGFYILSFYAFFFIF